MYETFRSLGAILREGGSSLRRRAGPELGFGSVCGAIPRSVGRSLTRYAAPGFLALSRKSNSILVP